jgi:hypothetical protein
MSARELQKCWHHPADFSSQIFGILFELFHSLWIDETQDCSPLQHEITADNDDPSLGGPRIQTKDQGCESDSNTSAFGAPLPATIRARIERTLIHSESLFNGLLVANGPYNMQVL